MNEYGIYTNDFNRLSNSKSILTKRFGENYIACFDRLDQDINNIVQSIFIKGKRYFIIREKIK